MFCEPGEPGMGTRPPSPVDELEGSTKKCAAPCCIAMLCYQGWEGCSVAATMEGGACLNEWLSACACACACGVLAAAGWCFQGWASSQCGRRGLRVG